MVVMFRRPNCYIESPVTDAVNRMPFVCLFIYACFETTFDRIYFAVSVLDIAYCFWNREVIR